MRKRKGTSRRVASEAGQLLKRSRSRKVRSVAGAALAERKLRTRRTSRRSKSHGLVSHPAGSRTASSANPYSSGALSSRRGDIRRNILAAEAHSEQRANHQIDADRSIRGLDLRHSRLARTEQLPELLLSHAAPAPLLPDRVRQPNFELHYGGLLISEAQELARAADFPSRGFQPLPCPFIHRHDLFAVISS